MDERERYFLNGNWVVDWPGRYETSGVAFHYERIKDSEVVRSRGPLQQDLIVMVNTSSQHLILVSVFNSLFGFFLGRPCPSHLFISNLYTVHRHTSRIQ